MAAERLAQFRTVRLLPFGRVGAQVERATIQATAAGRVSRRGSHRAIGLERQAVTPDARRHCVLVRSLEPLLDLARLLTPLGQVQQQQHIGDQLLSVPVEPARSAPAWLLRPVGLTPAAKALLLAARY